MRPGEKLSLLLKLLLPFIVLFSLNAHPKSYAVTDALNQFELERQAGQYHEAARALRLAVEREPWRAALWEQIGINELEAGQIPEAIEALQKASAAGRISAEGVFRLGEAYKLAGNAGLAEAAWRGLLTWPGAAQPGLNSRVFEQLVQIHHERGDYAAAVEILRAWRAAEPENPRVAFMLGLYLTVVEPDQAVPFLVAASQMDTAFTPMVQKIRRGINQAAETEEPGLGWVLIGRALGSAGVWDLAAEAFRLATIAAPSYAEAWAFLAEARYQMGSSGRQELARAVELDPDSVVVRALAALDYRRQGKPEQALIYLQEVAGQEPDEPIWQVELANVQVELGDLQAALSHYQKAVELAPASSLYWQHLARFSIEYGMDVHGLGLPAARQAVLLAPDDPAALDVMGWAMVSLADFASAERFLHQAISKDAAYAPALLHLGQLYLQQDDLSRAYPYLKRAAALSGPALVGETARRLLHQYYGEDS